MTIWPNKLNPLPVLTVVRPVVERAEAAVNKASRDEIGAEVRLSGSASSTHPART